MKLSQDQRRLLQQGDCTSLLFPYDSDATGDHGRPADVGSQVVLGWDEERRVADPFGNVTVVPARPVHWVVVTAVNRHRKGDWQVRFDVHDLREHPRFLGPGGTYTTSRFRAIDDLEVIPSKDQERMAKVAYDRDRALRLERVAAAQTDRWRQKRNRQRAAMRFRPAA